MSQGQPCTWRTRLIQVAARVTATARRVVVKICSRWPYLEHYRHISQRVLILASACGDSG